MNQQTQSALPAFAYYEALSVSPQPQDALSIGTAASAVPELSFFSSTSASAMATTSLPLAYSYTSTDPRATSAANTEPPATATSAISSAARHYAMGSALAVVSAVTVCGNFLVLLVFLRTPQLRTPTYCFLISLAFADFVRICSMLIQYSCRFRPSGNDYQLLSQYRSLA